MDSWESCEIEDANVKLKCNFTKGFGPIVMILYPIILLNSIPPTVFCINRYKQVVLDYYKLQFS